MIPRILAANDFPLSINYVHYITRAKKYVRKKWKLEHDKDY